MTEASQCAKLIRAELKGLGYKNFSVTSETYSGGDSVNIDPNGSLTIEEKNELQTKLRKKYMIGSFDTYSDSYEYSNRNREIPQVTFLFVN